MIRIKSLIICIALFSVSLTGCAGYRLGSTLSGDIKTIAVPTVINASSEPLLESVTTQAIISEVQKDGTLSIANESSADVILKVTVINYRLNSVRFNKDRAKTTQESRLTLTANIELQDAAGKVISRGAVSGESIFEPGGDITAAKRQALPAAASDLAHDIVESVVEAW